MLQHYVGVCVLCCAVLLNGDATGVSTETDALLHAAVRSGHAAAVELLLKRSAKLDVRDAAGRTELHHAAELGYKDIMKLLISARASCDAQDKRAETPLHLCADADHAAAVELLLQHRSSVDALNSNLQTPLHLAARGGHSRVASLLVRGNAPVNAADELRWTALHWAALHGDKVLANLLVMNRADVNAGEHWSCTPLHWAARRGHLLLAKLLIDHGADAEKVDVENRSAAIWARIGGHDRVASFLQGSAFAEAMASERTEDTGAPLGLLDAAMEGDLTAVQQALDSGESVHTQDEWGSTALHAAAQAGHLPIVQALLGRSASAAARDNWMRSPLLLAYPNAAVAQTLLQHGAAVDEVDADARTPLHWSVLEGSSASIQFFVGQKADLTHLDRWGRGVLHHAAANGHQVVGWLLANRGQADAKDHSAQTPLHLAAAGGFVAAVGELLGSSAEVDASDIMGRTPLHYASIHGHVEVVTSLLVARANVGAQDYDSQVASSFAKVLGHARLESLLRMPAQAVASMASRVPVADRLVAVGAGRRALAIAYRRSRWTLLASGKTDVGEDSWQQHYGRRSAQWARLRHKNGAIVFFANHHGPLPVSISGDCAGSATAYNIMRLIAQNAHPGDAIILVGDFNAQPHSSRIRALDGYMHRVFTGTSHHGVDHIYSNCGGSTIMNTSNVGAGGSDHDALNAVFHIPTASADSSQAVHAE